MKRFHREILVAAVLTGLLPGAASARERWFEVTTPHFVVVSDASESKAREVARDFEEIRLVFQLALPRARTDGSRLWILAVKDQKGLKKILPEFWEGKRRFRPGGIFRRTGYRQEIALIAGRSSDDGYSIVYHEYFHYLASLNTPGLPSWLNEGLASYWENTTLREDRIVVGQPSARHVQTLRNGAFLPIEDVLTGSPFTVDEHRVGVFYAQAWALTHYLLIGDRAIRQPTLADYVKRVTEGEESLDAATAAFGDLEELETALRNYTRRFLFNALQMRTSPDIDAGSFDVRELPDAESLAIRGRFVASGGLPEKAESMLEDALDKDAANAIATEGMGLLELRRGRREEAVKWLERSVASPKASALAHLLLATSLANGARVEEHLLRAISIDHDFAPAFAELAYYYGATDPKLDRALAMAKEASAREPGDAEHRLLVARVLLSMGEEAAAAEEAKRAVKVAVWNAHGYATNNVCWYGSLGGLASAVLSACEHAVRQQPEHANFRDSRGLARALVGDLEGAAEDFQSYVDAGVGSDDDVARRKEWIRLLEKGSSPFDEKTLAELRGRPF